MKNVLGVVFVLFLVVLSSCGPQADEAVANESRKLEGPKKTQREMIRLLFEAGFRPPEIPTMVCVAKWESGFYERARHSNRNGSVDHGLFQINDRWWGLQADDGCGFTNEQLLIAQYNVRCARKVYLKQGLRAWYGYLKHKAECDHYVL